MDNRDQPVSLAAAVLSIQPNDGGDLTSPACQTSQDGLQEFPHPAGGVAVLEEDCGVGVFLGSRVVDDLGEVGGELFVLSNYPKTGCNPRKIQDLRAFSDSYLVVPAWTSARGQQVS